MTIEKSYCNITLEFDNIEPRTRKEEEKMAFDYRKLEGLIVEKFGTQSNFAEALGWSNSRVSARLNGTAKFSTEDIKLWSNVLGIPADEIPVYFFTLKVR